jgi:hypothetical protein
VNNKQQKPKSFQAEYPNKDVCKSFPHKKFELTRGLCEGESLSLKIQDISQCFCDSSSAKEDSYSKQHQ